MSAPCVWCGAAFEPGDRGEPKRFCSARCRAALHGAARRWALAALARGELTVAQLRNAPGEPYTVGLRPSDASGAVRVELSPLARRAVK